MKISEGIKIGSYGKRQIKGAWYDKNDGICAAWAYIRLPCYTPDPSSEFNRLYPEITRRNDNGQTFAQIIEWLESIGQ